MVLVVEDSDRGKTDGGGLCGTSEEFFFFSLP